ncbi:hypothetical protein BGZ99_000618 [Dissophora globulifera]|uniref:Leucine rich repeat domain-containing protein n=1 Tax=Dissophora globulifera TaxID=979702 RepID=A0A9P6RPI2_9FUNG|nr:hypothetical protein BGZ99_000618 [Dissophora globulifera]
MDKPINGDKYVRTLSHYLRHNQKRLIPVELDVHGNLVNPSSSSSSHDSKQQPSTGSPISHGVRSFITPADPMAAAYSGMVNSLWSVGSAVINTVTPASSTTFSPSTSTSWTNTNQPQRPQTFAQDRDSFQGAWDGTGTIPADANPRERQLYLQAQLKSPIFPLDLYYLMYLLDRFELEGIEIEGWEGSTPRAIGDSKPRILNNGNSSSNGMPITSTYSSFPPPNASTRPQSIRSFSSTALSTLTLITGWKQWSNAASSAKPNTVTISDDIHFIHKFLKRIQGLRLIVKIPPGLATSPGTKGRIDGYSGDGIMHLLNVDQLSSTFELATSAGLKSMHPILLPLGATFSSLTHLELHKIPPRSVDGWEVLMPNLKSLVVIQASMEDVYDLLVTAVVESERRRRQRIAKEKNRAVLIRQEQREAMKDATVVVTKGRRLGNASVSSSSSAASSLSPKSAGSPESASSATRESSQRISPPSPSLIPGADATGEDEEAILKSIRMWPVLRHLSVSDNALPTLKNQDTFSYAQSIATLDISHNLLIAPPPGLIHLHNLHSLNLSFNMIESVLRISQILGNIAVLDLRGNRLESLCGLERLWNLEKIDVRQNHLDEAAEVGRLAALPGIREPKYRLEILAVFKANGHDLLLDGTFASFTEKRALANMSPTSFSTTIASINIVNPANIPAASEPTAVLAKDLISPPPRVTRPGSSSFAQLKDTDKIVAAAGRGVAKEGTGSNAATLSPSLSPGGSSAPPMLVKKKLVKSAKRTKRVVNLDSDHEDEGADEGEGEGNESTLHPMVLGSPAEIGKKKTGATKKKTSGKKKVQGVVSFAGDDTNHNNGESAGSSPKDSNGDGNEGYHTSHVHRAAQLELSMSSLQVSNDSDQHPSPRRGSPKGQPTKGILKKPSGAFRVGGGQDGHNPRHTSPHGSNNDSSDEDGADRYRRKIEAMRNEAGSNWLKVLAEMDSEAHLQRTSSDNVA